MTRSVKFSYKILGGFLLFSLVASGLNWTPILTAQQKEPALPLMPLWREVLSMKDIQELETLTQKESKKGFHDLSRKDQIRILELRFTQGSGFMPGLPPDRALELAQLDAKANFEILRFTPEMRAWELRGLMQRGGYPEQEARELRDLALKVLHKDISTSEFTQALEHKYAGTLSPSQAKELAELTTKWCVLQEGFGDQQYERWLQLNLMRNPRFAFEEWLRHHEGVKVYALNEIDAGDMAKLLHESKDRGTLSKEELIRLQELWFLRVGYTPDDAWQLARQVVKDRIEKKLVDVKEVEEGFRRVIRGN